MLCRFAKVLVVLLPIGAFALALRPVQKLMFTGETTKGIILLLVALVLLAVVEGVLFRYWVLPGWGEKMAERLYAGSYIPENDDLACMVERIAQAKDATLLPGLRQMVLRQPQRLRGWLELARLQQELLPDPTAALTTLEEASAAVRDREDAAMLLYRAGSLCESALRNTARAREFWQRAADSFPATVYGARSASRLG